MKSGVITVFAAEAGWPYGEVKDTDLVYQMEKDWIMSHPVREVSQFSWRYSCIRSDLRFRPMSLS